MTTQIRIQEQARAEMHNLFNILSGKFAQLKYYPQPMLTMVMKSEHPLDAAGASNMIYSAIPHMNNINMNDFAIVVDMNEAGIYDGLGYYDVTVKFK